MLLTEYDEEKRIRIMTKQIEIERQRTQEANQCAETERLEKERVILKAEKEREEYQKQIEQLQQQM